MAADDGKNPRARTDDAGVGIGLEQAGVALLAQELAEFEAYVGHDVPPCQQRATGG